MPGEKNNLGRRKLKEEMKGIKLAKKVGRRMARKFNNKLLDLFS